MNPIKVLQVNKLYYPEIGGIEKTLQQISEDLNKHSDFNLEVLVCQKKGKKCVEEINKVKVSRSKSFGVLASVPIAPFFIFDFCKIAKGKDIIQFHMPFPLGDLACLFSGYKGYVSAYWHSDVVKQKSWMCFYRPIMKWFLKRADVILVGSSGIVDGSEYLKPYRSKCRVVPFAVNSQILEGGDRFLRRCGFQESRKEAGTTNFLFVGRLVYYKGGAVMLEAFEHVLRSMKKQNTGKEILKKNVVLTIIGDGPLKKELEHQAKHLKIGENVQFLGSVEDDILKKNLETADVFVFPSMERSEAFGLVQLEAMAYGIPVINTKLPSGVPEVSIHGETGITVTPGNVTELAAAMELLAVHTEERIRLGIAARKRVEKEFTQKKMTERIKKIYENCI